MNEEQAIIYGIVTDDFIIKYFVSQNGQRLYESNYLDECESYCDDNGIPYELDPEMENEFRH